jgi:hypothetical protein
MESKQSKDRGRPGDSPGTVYGESSMDVNGHTVEEGDDVAGGGSIHMYGLFGSSSAITSATTLNGTINCS